MKSTTTSKSMSENELAQLGGGTVAFIKAMSTAQATKAFPQVEGLPQTGVLYGLFAADGTALALTDTRFAAIGYAKGQELEVASVH